MYGLRVSRHASSSAGQRTWVNLSGTPPNSVIPDGLKGRAGTQNGVRWTLGPGASACVRRLTAGMTEKICSLLTRVRSPDLKRTLRRSAMVERGLSHVSRKRTLGMAATGESGYSRAWLCGWATSWQPANASQTGFAGLRSNYCTAILSIQVSPITIRIGRPGSSTNLTISPISRPPVGAP